MILTVLSHRRERVKWGRCRPAWQTCSSSMHRMLRMDGWMDGCVSIIRHQTKQPARNNYTAATTCRKKEAWVEKQQWNKLLYAWHSNEPPCFADITFPSIQKWFTREERNPFLVKYLDSKQPIFTAIRLREMLCFGGCNPKGTINSRQSKDKRLYKSCVSVSVMAESTANQSFVHCYYQLRAITRLCLTKKCV